MGMKHTATMTGSSIHKVEMQNNGTGYSPIIQNIMKNGTNLNVMSVTIASSASPTANMPM